MRFVMAPSCLKPSNSAPLTSICTIKSYKPPPPSLPQNNKLNKPLTIPQTQQTPTKNPQPPKQLPTLENSTTI